MSGIINSAGSKSGVIGRSTLSYVQRSGTVNGSNITVTAAAHFQLADDDVSDTSILTYSAGTWTVVMAGLYMCTLTTATPTPSTNSTQLFLYLDTGSGFAQVGEPIYARTSDTQFLPKVLTRVVKCKPGDSFYFSPNNNYLMYQDFTTIQITRLGA